MSAIDVTDRTLSVRLSRTDKLLGLLRDQDVPLDAVVRAEPVQDALGAVRGIRAPGLGLPGRRMLGTWRGRGGTRFVDVRRGQPAVRVLLRGHRYDELLLGTDDPDALVARLARFAK